MLSKFKIIIKKQNPKMECLVVYNAIKRLKNKFENCTFGLLIMQFHGRDESGSKILIEK